MTSVLQYRDPMSFRSHDPLHPTNFVTPPMSSLKKETRYEGHSSGSESKKAETTPGAKRRPSRAGTRSVTTLTKEQLERKRANDREAQRAIRQRTKDHIADLERQIQDLTARLHNSEPARLMEIMRRNEQLEEENSDLRARLSHYEAVPLSANTQNQGSMIPGSDHPGLMQPAMPNAPSPSDRVSMLSQPRRPSTSTPRGLNAVPEMTTPVSQPGHWQPQTQVHSYASHAASPHGQASPHLSMVPGRQDQVQWSPHHTQSSHHSASMSVQDPSLHAMDSPGIPYPSGYPVDNNGRSMSYPLENQQLVTSQPMPLTGYNTPTTARSPHPADYQRPLSLPLNGHTSAPHSQHQHPHPQHQHPHPQQQQAPQTPYSSFSTPTHPTFVSPTSHPGEMQPMMTAPQPQPQIMNEQQHHMMYQH